MTEYKVLITGSMGAGKTTAIATISDVPPVTTEVQNNDPNSSKAFTTVGLDYGEVMLPQGERLRLYGTPGQERFRFMWKILSQGALGLIILIDNSRPAPLEDLRLYLTSFEQLIRQQACVVAIGRSVTHTTPSLDDFVELLASHGFMCPVIEADVRRREDVLIALDLLLLQLENQVNAS